MFKKLVVVTAFVVGLVGATANANTITVTSGPVITPSGPNYTWDYEVVLIGNSSINTGDFFTIFDFYGFTGTTSITPGATAAADWSFSSANLGTCGPFGGNDMSAYCAANDSAGIPNLTWTYVGAGISQGGGFTSLGHFIATSTGNQPVNDGWVSRDNDNQTGRIDEGASGGTNVPQVPEPASLLLIGSGLLGLARARSRRARK